MKKLFFVTCILILWPAITLADDVFNDDAFNKDTKKAQRIGYELYGGYITDLAIDDSGRMYASTLSSNGIFHSTDSAETWAASVGGTDIGKVNALVVSDEPDTAYVVGGISLYKTVDGGVNWIELTGSRGDAEQNDFNLVLAYSNGILAAPVRNGSVDISTDEGESFTNVVIAEDVTTSSIVGNADGSKFYILAAAGNDQTRTLYVLDVASGTISVTDQSGNYAWVGVNPLDPDTIVIAGADGALYTTTGEEGTWGTLTDEPITGEVNFIGDRIYLGDKYTDDLGETINNVIVTANQLAVDPNNSNLIIVGSGTGIQLSTDGGESWSENAKSNGLLGVTVNDIAQTNNKEQVWLAAQGGLAHTTDFLSATPSWEYPILPDQASSNTECVWVDPNDADHIVAGAGNLFVSTNGGDTWTVAEGDENLVGTFADIVADGDTLYAAFIDQQGTSGTVYTSTDGGSTWTDIGGLNAPANDLALLSDGTLVVGTGYEFSDDETQHGIFLYDGSTWEQVSLGTDQSISSVVVVGESIYAVGTGSPDGKLLRSQDSGVTWEDITDNGLPSDAYFHSITAADADTLYVATGRPAGTSYVYKSADGGDNWSLLYTGLVDEEFNEMIFDGLLTGTTVGLQSLFSKANVDMSIKGRTLTIQLKDVATKTTLDQRKLKLYKKTKRNGEWKQMKIDPKRTNSRGKLRVKLTQDKTTYYQARWQPNDTDAATYNTATIRSDRLKVKGDR